MAQYKPNIHRYAAPPPVSPPPVLPVRQSAPVIPSGAKRLAADNAVFAFDLLRRTASTPGNLVLSPHSISTALGMVLAGAEGETARNLARVAGWSLPRPYPHGEFKGLEQALAPPAMWGSAEYEWFAGNRIWLGAPLLPRYAAALRDQYDAEPGVLQTDRNRAADDINAWVADRTRGRLASTVSARSLEGARFVLINAAFFKGAWADPFDPADTAMCPFRLVGRRTSSVAMMPLRLRSTYFAGPGFEAARLWYVGGVSLDIVLPELGAFERVSAGLTAGEFESARTGAETVVLDLRLPKLKLETRRSLVADLSGLGASRVFSPEAEFGLVSSEPVTLGGVEHAASFSLDELGAEAAAATGAMAAGGLSPRRVKFHVDRPFLFLLRHEATGAILFAGRVVDPTA